MEQPFFLMRQKRYNFHFTTFPFVDFVSDMKGKGEGSVKEEEEERRENKYN